MKKINRYTFSLIFFFMIGSILPFIPPYAVLLAFFLIIPIAIAIFTSIMAFLMGLIASNKLLRINALKTILVFLVFFGSHVFSVFIVDGFLNYKSEILIRKIEEYKIANKKYPTDLNHISNFYDFGIEYNFDEGGNYELEYSRGFMVREVYSNTNKKWESLGWND